MAYASRAGRARTSASNPRAHAICDFCGFRYNREDLQWQMQWGGTTLINLRQLVCRRCKDVPQDQLRSIILPADPLPISQPRTEPFLSDETDYRVTAAPSLIDPVTGIPIPQGTPLATLTGDNRTTQPIGRPTGLEAVPNLYEAVEYGPTLSILSLVSDGFYTVTATCSQPHGLSTNSQISVEGASSNMADGAYSVIVTTAMAFSYTTTNVTPQGGLLTGATQVWTLKVGLPRGYVQIPIVAFNNVLTNVNSSIYGGGELPRPGYVFLLSPVDGSRGRSRVDGALAIGIAA